MDKRIKARWVKALRSGKYTQGRRRLCRVSEDNQQRHCCLGVLCELAVRSKVISAPELKEGIVLYDGSDMELPSMVMRWAGLDDSNPIVSSARMVVGSPNKSLAVLNDGGRTFQQIANYIEKSL